MKTWLRTNYLYLLPWLVLLLSLLIAYQLWRSEENNGRREAELLFLHETEEIKTAIIERMNTYELMLQGFTSLFNASVSVERNEWKAYFQTIDPLIHYPGIQAIGYVKRVAAADKEAFVQQVRTEGFPQYAIWPEGDRLEYFPVLYIDPLTTDNQKVMGYDAFFEPARKTALDEARDRGAPVISGGIILQQEDKGSTQKGFIMYLPQYRTNRVLGNAAERAAELQGLIYAAFRMGDFLRAALKTREGLAWRIYDGRAVDDRMLLYDSAGPGDGARGARAPLHEKTSTIEFFGRAWTLCYAGLPEFEAAIHKSNSLAIACCSLLVSLLLFGITFLTVSRSRVLSRELARREQLEQQLKESEQRYHAIMEQACDSIIIHDTNGRIVNVNQQTCENLGYLREELISRAIEDIDPDAIRNGKDELWARIVAGEHFTFESRQVRKNGTLFPVEVTLGPLRLSSGTAILGIVRDITARKKAMEELRRASQKWRSTFDAMLDPVALLAPDATIQQCNLAFTQFVALPFDAIIGQKCYMLVHKTFEPPRECPVLTAKSTKKRQTTELQTGGKFFHIITDPILDGDGTVTGIVHIMRDSTEQKKVEDALRQSEQRMRLHVDQTMLAVIDFDADFRVRAWNSGAEKIFGYTPQEAIGRKASDIILPENVKEHADIVWRDLLAQQGGSHSINDNIRKDGTRICCEWHNTPLTDASGTVIGVVSIGQDITERKRMEDDLRTLRLAVEQSIDGIGYAALDGTILFTNKAWADMHGLRLDEIIGRPMSIFHTPEQMAHEVIPFNEYARAAGSQKGEVGHVRKDGSCFPTMMSSTVVKNDNGQATGFLGIARDIT